MDQETKWIKAIQKQSNEGAANQLIQKYYKEIFAFVYKQTLDKDLAQDITQEVFISMLRTIHRFDGRASFRTWLYKIGNSRIIDHYRSKYYKIHKQSVVIEVDKFVEGDEFTLELEKKDEVKRILELLSRFDHELQEIFRLKIFGEYTFLEIAATTNLSESTLKTKYYATIRKLKKLLKEDSYE
ncbi:sigma-70 family RNA polymerase sigma factor [Bacillus sp. BGMRC 2118]|nr:sigma-70 family RNA polymerase sigma factor [Bacillus sp. BGMRC 2118]